MERAINAIRYYTIGVEAPKPQTPPKDKRVAAYEYTERERLLLLTQQTKLEQKLDELNDLEAEIQREAARGNQAALKRRLVPKKNALQEEIRQLHTQIENQKVAKDSMAKAETHKTQALLMKDGADQLEELVGDMEAIDIDAAVDKFKDNVIRTNEFGSRLSEPLWDELQVGQNEEGVDVDDEVAQLMAQYRPQEVVQEVVSFPNVSSQNLTQEEAIHQRLAKLKQKE